MKLDQQNRNILYLIISCIINQSRFLRESEVFFCDFLRFTVQLKKKILSPYESECSHLENK